VAICETVYVVRESIKNDVVAGLLGRQLHLLHVCICMVIIRAYDFL